MSRLISIIILLSMIELNALKLIDILSRKKLRARLICTPYVKTRVQFVDILTNGVSSSVLHSALCKLLCEISLPQLDGEC